MKRTIRREDVIECNNNTCGKCAHLGVKPWDRMEAWCHFFDSRRVEVSGRKVISYARLPECRVAEVKVGK